MSTRRTQARTPRPTPDEPSAGAAPVETFAAELDHVLPGKAASDAEADFAAQMRQDWMLEAGLGLDPATLADIVADFWAFAERRQKRDPKIDLRPVGGEEGHAPALWALMIVQDDQAFLVDTVMGEITERGCTVRAMFHPLVTVRRDRAGRRAETGAHRRELMILVLLELGAGGDGEALVQGVSAALADARASVADFKPMRDLMDRAIAELEAGRPGGAKGVSGEERAEDLAFLRWLNADHFVFLGARVYDYPRDGKGAYAAEEPRADPAESLGVLRDPGRVVLRRDSEPAILSAQARRRLGDVPLVVAKSNMLSRVHRRGYLDYVGVKRYGPDGRAFGEIRFVGLFTLEAYQEPVREVPLIRRKAARVIARAAKAAGGHREKRLQGVLQTYPRDELFQMSEDDLLRISLGLVHLEDRPRASLFARHDPFDRFVSVLFLLPQDRYTSDVDRQVGEMLAHAWGGRVSAAYPSFSDGPLARVHYIVGVRPGAHPEPDMDALQAEAAAAIHTWRDDFAETLRASGLEPERMADISRRYADAFPARYRDLFSAAEALADIEQIETATDAPIKVRAYRTAAESERQFRFKLYREGGQAPLSDVLPIVENMGLKGMIEDGVEVTPLRPDGTRASVWVHDFLLEDDLGDPLDFEAVRDAFEDAVVAVWAGRTENDPFNRLVVELGASWREAALIRALARYRQQSSMDPSQRAQTAALANFPGVARLILDLFRTRFDPAIRVSPRARAEQSDAVFGRIVEALQRVESLDADRVLRRLAMLVQAIQRTNYFQPDEDGEPKPYIAFKIASRELEHLPDPKPFREIFVWAPHVEAVHLRFGPVARGGIRWSDRRDDFRTEVLGLAKAQQVKNAVIVPVGAKGGFYPKQLPRGGTPEQIRAEGVRAYTTFLHGLLDLTDNLGAKGEVIPPPSVIVHDEDDPYLVVAADKGTATFSDIANGVAAERGFWLGDAFASGGSQGYDHKAMGITARGAWEAVKRHFRELGKDIQSEPFTVAGVGDMSGDVFGNGMLLSTQIRLVAAFDHRHVFIDPDPDPATSFAERQRLFALARSSWADYDPALISKGGGVFPRSAKQVTLTAEIQALLGIKDQTLTPSDLVRAVLKAPCELLYFGGIGCYVKAPHESDAEVGDKTNDLVRVNGDELRCKVVGEGANLGFTQAGRIVFARAGGRIDTDAIDNSAGVDCSDHEVNIKILTGAVERAGGLKRKARDALLVRMTDDVASHVLEHNYGQTLALSLLEATAAQDLESHAEFMARLVAEGRLDRKVEGLPGPAALAEMAAAGQGLARPELAVLLAYGKLELCHDILESAAPDDPYFFGALKAYFPKPLARYEADMKRHRLRREIIATVLANDIVNMAGFTFPQRLRDAAGCDTAGLVVAFEAARRIFRLDRVWAEISALDGKIPAKTQLDLYREIVLLQRRQTYWMARARRGGQTGMGAGVEALIAAYQPAVDSFKAVGLGLLAPFERQAAEARAKTFIRAGAPEPLARMAAGARALMAASDVADMARKARWAPTAAARVYVAAGAAFGFDRVRAAAGALPTNDAYERMAARRMIEDLLAEQAATAQAVIAFCGNADAGADAASAKAAVQAWAGLRRDEANTARDHPGRDRGGARRLELRQAHHRRRGAGRAGGGEIAKGSDQASRAAARLRPRGGRGRRGPPARRGCGAGSPRSGPDSRWPDPDRSAWARGSPRGPARRRRGCPARSTAARPPRSGGARRTREGRPPGR